MNATSEAQDLARSNTMPESEPGTPPSPTEDRLPKLAAGSTIPDTRLQIVNWLGQGGMGVVFEVRHLDIERRFAAKLLNVAKSPARTRRFRDEARTISQIGSPWIVEIFDFKELSDGRLMYLMELVEGPSLYTLLRDHGPMELSHLLGLARQVCKGLHDAHQVGFIHRDVKPENIMIGIDADGREQVKLVDFGLAALLEGPKDANTGGTPAYMSPEQCRGIDADVRTDIYSLGVTLYELACGQLPFDATDSRVCQDAHVDEVPPPPSTHRPSLPPGFDRLIARCLAKQPEQRYASAAELEAALLELQFELQLRTDADDLPPPVLDDARQQRRLEDGLAQLRNAEQQAERRRVIAGVALLACISLAAGIGWQVESRERAAEVDTNQRELEQLAERAHQAATHARWVYPTADEPEAETAFKVLLEIEALARPSAIAVGRELRQEFANTLVGLGDRYWDYVGGRQFAKEFYLQALHFQPDHARANERLHVRPLALQELTERASRAEYSAAELSSLAPLVALANADPRARLNMLDALSQQEQLPPRTAEDIDRLITELGGAAAKVDEPEPSSSDHGDVVAHPAGGDEPGHTGESAETGDGDEPDAKDPSSPRPSSKTGGEIATAKKLYAAGRVKDAERLFKQELTRDRTNIDALVGLNEIAFDRSDFRQALEYARRAVEIAPKRGSLHMLVGDACMKVLDYGCARTHYETAKQLGVSSASKRLQILSERSGGAK